MARLTEIEKRQLKAARRDPFCRLDRSAREAGLSPTRYLSFLRFATKMLPRKARVPIEGQQWML